MSSGSAYPGPALGFPDLGSFPSPPVGHASSPTPGQTLTHLPAAVPQSCVCRPAPAGVASLPRPEATWNELVLLSLCVCETLTGWKPEVWGLAGGAPPEGCGRPGLPELGVTEPLVVVGLREHHPSLPLSSHGVLPEDVSVSTFPLFIRT